MFSSAWPALLNKNLIDCQDIKQDLFGTFLCPGQGFCDDSLVWVFFFNFPILCQLSIVTHWDSWLYSINSGTTGCTTQLFSWMLSMSVKGMAFHRFFLKKGLRVHPVSLSSFSIPYVQFHGYPSTCSSVKKTKKKNKKAKQENNREKNWQ